MNGARSGSTLAHTVRIARGREQVLFCDRLPRPNLNFYHREAAPGTPNHVRNSIIYQYHLSTTTKILSRYSCTTSTRARTWRWPRIRQNREAWKRGSKAASYPFLKSSACTIATGDRLLRHRRKIRGSDLRVLSALLTLNIELCATPLGSPPLVHDKSPRGCAQLSFAPRPSADEYCQPQPPLRFLVITPPTIASIAIGLYSLRWTRPTVKQHDPEFERSAAHVFVRFTKRWTRREYGRWVVSAHASTSSLRRSNSYFVREVLAVR